VNRPYPHVFGGTRVACGRIAAGTPKVFASRRVASTGETPPALIANRLYLMLRPIYSCSVRTFV
jgi:hypothetical protein